MIISITIGEHVTDGLLIVIRFDWLHCIRFFDFIWTHQPPPIVRPSETHWVRILLAAIFCCWMRTDEFNRSTDRPTDWTTVNQEAHQKLSIVTIQTDIWLEIRTQESKRKLNQVKIENNKKMHVLNSKCPVVVVCFCFGFGFIFFSIVFCFILFAFRSGKIFVP